MPLRAPHPEPGVPDTRGCCGTSGGLSRCQPWQVLRGSLVGTAWMVGLSVRPHLIARATERGCVEDYNPEHGPPSRIALLRCDTCGSAPLFAQEDYGDGWDEMRRNDHVERSCRRTAIEPALAICRVCREGREAMTVQTQPEALPWPQSLMSDHPLSSASAELFRQDVAGWL